MDEVTHIHLKMLQGRLGDVVYELTKTQFSYLSPLVTWRPAINAYRCADHIIICVELAGVDRSSLDLRVESRRVRIGGRREAPEPTGQESKALQILAMEIDYGAFERQVELPYEIDTGRVRVEQRNGLLWIVLPMQSES